MWLWRTCCHYIQRFVRVDLWSPVAFMFNRSSTVYSVYGEGRTNPRLFTWFPHGLLFGNVQKSESIACVWIRFHWQQWRLFHFLGRQHRLFVFYATSSIRLIIIFVKELFGLSVFDLFHERNIHALLVRYGIFTTELLSVCNNINQTIKSTKTIWVCCCHFFDYK